MRILLPLAFTALLPAQNAPAPKPEIKNDTVVLETAGKKVTVGEVAAIVESLPPQMRQNYTRDPKGFLQQWFMLKRLVGLAEQGKLAEKSPYKEGIEIARMQVLWQAQIEETTRTIPIAEAELKTHYEAKKDGYTQAKLKLIYIPFLAQPAATGATPEKKTLTEAEALAKSEKLVAEARKGSDFVKMVKENSEDPISRDQEGNFGPIKKSDTLPDAIKQAVFALKTGDVGDPVRQPNGYYVFKMVELAPQEFKEIRVAIENDLRSQKIREWMDANAKAVEVKVERPDFFESVKQ